MNLALTYCWKEWRAQRGLLLAPLAAVGADHKITFGAGDFPEEMCAARITTAEVNRGNCAVFQYAVDGNLIGNIAIQLFSCFHQSDFGAPGGSCC